MAFSYNQSKFTSTLKQYKKAEFLLSAITGVQLSTGLVLRSGFLAAANQQDAT